MADPYEELEAQIDKELLESDPSVGITFSTDMYRNFGRRGLIKFHQIEAALGPYYFPLYKGKRHAWADWKMDDLTYKIGKIPDA